MRSARSYQREIQKLMGIIEQVEWVQPTYNGSPSCSYCGAQQHWGHDKNCTLFKVLKASRAL